MKSVVITFLLASVCTYVSAEGVCTSTNPNPINKEWKFMTNGCVSQVKEQIQKEVKASMGYLAMGAHFARDIINRPGFSKFFFESAGEEREHANKLIEYLLMRGELDAPEDITKLIVITAPNITTWENGVSALRDALKTEVEVTKSIKKLIQTCEEDEKIESKNDNNDYHFVDYLTGVFLEEQFKGQRELAGKISTLEKMMLTHGVLGEFLFDKKL